MSTTLEALQTDNLNLSSLNYSEKQQLLELLKEKDKRARQNNLSTYKPYAKQKEFHLSGASYRERLFSAGNQLGKTLSGAFEVAYHLTGKYPVWWEGRRFDKPVSFLAGSVTYELTRDGVQRLLVGPPMSKDDWGTGAIPAKDIVSTTRRSNVSGAIDSVSVRHVSGGVSVLYFKAYDQGREKWQAATVDGVWFDEEPPLDVYIEGITRTNVGGGMIMVTFTPLLGMSEVVARFLLEESSERKQTTMTIYDVDHFTDDERQKIIDSYPPHEREARTKGIPSLGSGRIFPVTEEDITITPIPIADHWVQIGGMDFGWDHPFAGACLAWDRDNDIIYVTKTYKQREATPIIHSAALRDWGDWLPWSWPHDGLQHDKGSGEQLAEQYRKNGLNLIYERATFEDGSNGVEAGISDMLQRMQKGQWKVFSTCQDWLEEFRLYHRKNGKIVKERDDVISASRYALMMLRYAESKPVNEKLDDRDFGYVV